MSVKHHNYFTRAHRENAKKPFMCCRLAKTPIGNLKCRSSVFFCSNISLRTWAGAWDVLRICTSIIARRPRGIVCAKSSAVLTLHNVARPVAGSPVRKTNFIIYTLHFLCDMNKMIYYISFCSFTPFGYYSNLRGLSDRFIEFTVFLYLL